MRKIRRVFTEKEIKLLESNPSVLRVSEKNITYSPAFKIVDVQASQAGHTPMEIFLQAGFNVELIGQETPKRCLERW
ncbi:HTH domain-containing protein [Paenibacillus sp. TC-CSREp1]|uniref:HTH domain-containing protein n=1 Tax=Paenibacillus sp. TC-CSREp1 TaxID=3410089 RepID=UPI003CE93372